MILEKGVIRTLEPAMPVALALAIAGDRIAGGVGTHETALPSPDRVDLGGRCVLPGLNDAHVHFPTWALAQREVRLEGAGSLDEALALVRSALDELPPGRWLRGRGWRSGDWSPAVEPTRQALDEIAGDIPIALTARDYHSLWLSSAALAEAGGDLEVEGGVVERDEQGEPTGVLREESAWRFRDRYLSAPDDEFVDAMRDGLKIVAARGVTAVHDKDGWLGAPRFWQRLADEDALTLRVWQSLPYDHIGRLEELGLRAGIGDDLLRLGYLKVFMDGTLGSQTARLMDGSGVKITGREELAEIVRSATRAGWPVAVHAIGDLANREALDAFEETRDEWAPLGCGSASSTRNSLFRKTLPASPSWESPPRSSSAMPLRIATSRIASGPAPLTAPTPIAPSSTQERCSPTARTHRSRSSTRWPASAPGCCARWTSASPGTPSRR